MPNDKEYYAINDEAKRTKLKKAKGLNKQVNLVECENRYYVEVLDDQKKVFIRSSHDTEEEATDALNKQSKKHCNIDSDKIEKVK